MFYLAQAIGLISLILVVISFQQNNKKKLLNCQIFSCFFFAIHYLLLNATTGFFMNLINIIRNIMFVKCGKKIPAKYISIIIVFIITMSIVFYDGFLSLIPGIAGIIYTLGASQKKLTITRISGVIAGCLFFVYNLKVFAIMALISTIIEILSIVLAIYRFDIKKKRKKR